MEKPIKIIEGVPTLCARGPQDLAGFELIDVRRHDEFTGELGHLKGSKLVTLGPDLEAYLRQTPKDTPILFVCRSGARSATATKQALALGFSQVFNFEGGMLRVVGDAGFEPATSTV